VKFYWAYMYHQHPKTLFTVMAEISYNIIVVIIIITVYGKVDISTNLDPELVGTLLRRLLDELHQENP